MAEEEKVTIVRGNPLIPAGDVTATLPDGTAIVSGPPPEEPAPRDPSAPANIVPEGEIVFAGVQGKAFAIYGRFGKSGTVTVGGVQVTVTSWRDIAVKGLLPRVADPKGEVVVTDGDGRVQIRPKVVPKAA